MNDVLLSGAVGEAAVGKVDSEPGGHMVIEVDTLFGKLNICWYVLSPIFFFQ
jgi:hypothetical protein